MNGSPALLLGVADSLITFECPMLAPGTQLAVNVITQNGTVGVPIQNSMLSATPALFVLDAARPGQGLVLIANSDALAMPAKGGFSGRPVQKGEYVSILATGLGEVQDGSPALAKNYVKVWIGGASVAPSFVGLIPGGAGLFQVIAQIPAGIT